MLVGHQITSFHDDGVLVVPGVLDEDDLDPVRAEFADALDRAAAELYRSGRIGSTHAGRPFAERYMAIVTECPEVFYSLGISLPLDYEALDPRWIRCHTGPALFGLLTAPKILDVVESIVGPEITINPVQQTRLKPPARLLSGATAEYSNIGETTWHQDFGAMTDEARHTDLVTVWVAMTDATEEMGCLVAMPGSHRTAELSLHCRGEVNPAENYIPQAVLDRHGCEPTPLPCRAGSLVLLTRWTEHGALTNRSERLRWSFDLRYQPTGQPTGRPAFPSFVVRSVANPDSVVTDPAEYAARWDDVRTRLVAGDLDGPLYEQDRWLAGRDHGLCA